MTSGGMSWVAAIAALLVAGCAGESPSLGGALGPAAAQSASPEPANATPAFNPFSDTPAAVGGREVIANPTIDEVMLAGPLGEMSWGRTEAPVTLIKYASLTCPHCRKFHLEVFPQLKREFIDTGKLRFILREFPIGRASGTATVALRCAPAEKYLDLYGRYLTQQAAWVSQEVRTVEIGKIAAQVGITGAQFQSCLENRDMVEKLNWVKERGRKLGIIGTPNFFINGKLVKTTIGMEEIRAAVSAAAVVGGKRAELAPAYDRMAQSARRRSE